MPILQIIDCNGQRIRGAAGNVMATMIFPKDRRNASGRVISAETRRRSLRAAAAAVIIREWDDLAERGPVAEGHFRMVSHSAWQWFRKHGGLRTITDINASEFITGAMEIEVVHGQAAGNMLLFMLAHNAAHPDEASVRTARYVIARLAGKSDEWVKLAWAQFRGVAHLWGALVLSNSWRDAPAEKKSLLALIDGDQFEPFLANSEFLRSEAERLPRHGYNNPLQPYQEIWTAPSMGLPAATVVIPAWKDHHAKLLREARKGLAGQSPSTAE